MKLDIDQIQQLMKALAEHGLSECKLETEGFSLKLTRETAAPAPQCEAAPAQPTAPPAKPAEEVPAGNMVRSPIVGTFYAQKSPEAPPYVTVGDRVRTGDVLFIIESMKLMNEVTSEFDGTVAEILVKSGEAVEYGQPLMRIE